MSDTNLIRPEELSKATDILHLGADFYQDAELQKKMEALPENIREDFYNFAYQSAFWKKVVDKATPFDYLKERKGSWDKDLGDFKILEYFPEDYTLEELNRLFPGWWTSNLKEKYYPDLRTITVKGNLFVEYPTYKGMKIVKRWAIGASRIEFKADGGKTEPSQPDDKFKAARTEWIKLAGKWFGIGLEIYHQRITPQLRSMFEDRIRNWGIYAKEAKDIVTTFETGHGFRNYLKELPTIEQTDRIIKALMLIPSNMANSKQENIHHLIWTNYVKCQNNTSANRLATEQYIKKIEATAQQIHQTNNKEKS